MMGAFADFVLDLERQKFAENQFRAGQAWKEMEFGLDQNRFLMELEDKKTQNAFTQRRLTLDQLEERRLRRRDRMMSEDARLDRKLSYDRLTEEAQHNRAMESYTTMLRTQAAVDDAINKQVNAIKLLDDQIEFSTKNLKPGATEDPMVTTFRRQRVGMMGKLAGMDEAIVTAIQASVGPYTAPEETLEPGQAASFITGLAPHLDAKGLSELTKSMEKATGIDFPELSLDQQTKLSDVQKIEMTVAQNLQKNERIDVAALKQAMDSIAAGKGIPFDTMTIAPPKSQALDALTMNVLLQMTPGKEGKLQMIARQMTAQAPPGKEYAVVDVNKGFGTDLRVMEYSEAVAAGVEEKELKKFAKHGQTPADEKKRRGMETKAALEALGVR